MTSEEAWQKQSKTIEHYREHEPEMLKHAARRSESEINSEIGIGNLPSDRPRGYLRLYPEDFIVEEKLSNGQIIKVDEIIPADSARGEHDNTLYARLIKIGIPTNVAIERIAQSLDFDINKIGFAGLKDADALTAQLVALSEGKLTVADIENRSIANLKLTGLRYGAGSLAPGDLLGNVFTITVRTEKPLDDILLKARTEAIAKYGVLNYFQSQRFGGLRLLSHKLGKLVLQGNYELAIRYFLFKSGIDDIPLVARLRREAEKGYPDFSKIKTIYEQLPYTFANELKLIDLLSAKPTDFIDGLLTIKSEVQNWTRAYACLLFNKYLSEHSKRFGVTTESFPMLLGGNAAAVKIYRDYLGADETLAFEKNLAPFNFSPMDREETARLWPEKLNFRTFENGVFLNFTLSKGHQTTTILSNLFELHHGLPVPGWINTSKIDPKEMLGQGSLKEIRGILKDYLYSKLDLQL